jgi:hypothetical protein
MLKKITKGNNPKATAQFGKAKQKAPGGANQFGKGSVKRITAQRRSGAK